MYVTGWPATVQAEEVYVAEWLLGEYHSGTGVGGLTVIGHIAVVAI